MKNLKSCESIYPEDYINRVRGGILLREQITVKEKGVISLLFLMLFASSAIFGFAIYAVAIAEYTKSSSKIEMIDEHIAQDNVLTSIYGNYRYNLLNDANYGKQKESIQKTCEDTINTDTPICLESSIWLKDYEATGYEIKKNNRDYSKDKWGKLKEGQYGTFHYMLFRNFTSTIEDNTVITDDDEITERYTQEYLVSTNWNESQSVVPKPETVTVNDFYRDGALYARNSIYIKVKFPDAISSIDVSYGGTDDNTLLKTNIRKKPSNLKDGSILYELPILNTNGRPLRIDKFVFSSTDGALESLGVSVLYARDLDVTINKLDPYRPSVKIPKYRTTIRIEQARDYNRVLELKKLN